MAEDYVSQDQHRADMADLRLELSNSLSSLDKRTELIAQDLMVLRREVNDRFDRMNERMTERFDRMNGQMTERFDRVGEQMAELRQSQSDLRQDMRHLQTVVQRQMWALIAVVAGGVIKVLFFS